MFERFTAEARDVVAGAQDEARSLRHRFIGTEHLLLSMLAGLGAGGELLRAHGMSAEVVRRELADRGAGAEALDADALARLGIDLDQVRRATEAQFGPGALAPGAQPMPKGHIPFSKRAKKVLELGLREAVALGSDEINSAHVLLGLLREGAGVGAQLIHDTGIDLVALAAEARVRAGRRAA